MTPRQTKSNDDKPSFFGKPEERRSCCSCRALLIGFIVVLILALAGIWYLIFEIKQSAQMPDLHFVGLEESVDMDSKIDEATSGDKSEATIVISEKELSQIIVGASKSSDWLAKIEPEGIEIYGRFKSMKGVTAAVEAEPEIKNNKLLLKIKKFSAGKARLPKMFLFLANSQLDNVVLIDGAKSGKIELSSVELQTGVMIVKGKVVGR